VIPLVSIVIPVYNGLKYTMDCIGSIDMYPPAFPIEIIVVGTGNDGTVSIMREFEASRSNFKFIHNPGPHTHFAAQVNLGVSQALGDFICVLNNDTLVTPKWLDQLVGCYSRISKLPDLERPCPPPAMVGPCSNYVMQHQLIQPPGDFKLSELPNFCADITKQNRGQWFYASIISGFCFLANKMVWDSLGGLDESLVNGNEDVDFCIRVNEAGYSCLVDRGTFIYHYGSKTLTANPELDTHSGTINRVALVEKLYGSEPKEQKITGCIRLKCSKEELDVWLTRHNSLFDTINIVDDDSGWDMGAHCKQNWPKVTYVNMPGKLEVEQRRVLYLLALEQKADWMVVLDHDELLEEKVDRAYLQRLANTPIPGCQAFVARWIHLWNSPETYHVKYPPSLGIFMRRVLPNLAYVHGAPDSSLHCSRIPESPVVGSAPTNVHIMHYGYVDSSQRKRKRGYYEDKDPNPIPRLVGGTTYRHLTDQTEIVISEWKGSKNYTISLAAMTEDEPVYQLQFLFEQMGPILDEIVMRVPPGSPSIPLLKRWGAKVIEKKWNDDYSDMRNSVINQCTSSYILVMDIDESLQDPMELIRLIELQPTAVMFTVQNVQPHGKPPAITEVMRMFQNRPDIRFRGLLHETIEDDMAVMRDKVIVRAHGQLVHTGFLKEKLPEKLKKYVKLNKRAIHLNPNDPKPYFNLALHFLEEGSTEEAMDYFIKAITLHPKFTLAKLELSKIYTRFAHAMIMSALDDIPEQHPMRQATSQYEKMLAQLVPPKEPELFPPTLVKGMQAVSRLSSKMQPQIEVVPVREMKRG
jgi:GT2 family glycosyltransferase/tetratricopeptide (TPR) repeat protein